MIEDRLYEANTLSHRSPRTRRTRPRLPRYISRRVHRPGTQLSRQYRPEAVGTQAGYRRRGRHTRLK